MKKITFVFIFCMFISGLYAQKKEVSGVVTSGNDGLPIPGANIIVEGTTNGTITNLQGEYKINVPKDAKLKFSFVGCKDQVIPVNGRSTINVVLNEDTEIVGEVTVIGYGNVKDDDISAAVTTVKSDELDKLAGSSFAQKLKGKSAGVSIKTESGAPGGESTVQIRSFGTLNYSKPLYVIDGVMMRERPEDAQGPTRVDYGTPMTDPLSMLNPNDIESITILKDASAAAVYGTRAANGVVLITTKKGSKGKPKINYHSYYGIQMQNQRIDLMSGPEFARFSEEGRKAAGMVPYSLYTNPDTLSTTNWQDEIFRTAPIQEHQLSISGGSEKHNYYASIAHFDQQGILPNSYFKRTSVRFNSDTKLHEKIKIGNTLNVSRSMSNSLPNGNLSGGIISSALTMPPYIPVTYIDEGGLEKYYGVGTYEALFAGRTQNPVYSAMSADNKNKVINVMGNIYLEAELLKGLTFKTDLGFDYNFGSSSKFRESYSLQPFVPNDSPVSENETPQASARSTNEENIKLDFILTYDRSFKKHNIIAMAGYAVQDFKQSFQTAESQGHLNNDLRTVSAGNNNTKTGTQALDESIAYLSQFGRLLYNYDQKYYFGVYGRRDGSSRFTKNYSYAFFPSVSAAWRISSEPFMKPLKHIIEDFKIRASMGQLGNDGGFRPVKTPLVVGAYPIVFDGNVFHQGYTPVDVPNPDLRWETTQQIDIGFDLSLFDNKLNIIFDYFQKKQFDIIIQEPAPFVVGITTRNYSPDYPFSILNIPDLSINYSGYECSINYNNSVGGVRYSIGGNFSAIRSNISGLESPIYRDKNFNGEPVIILENDHPIDQFYGYKTDGIITDEEDPALDRQDNAALGDMRFVDIDGNDTINVFDKTFIGDPNPSFSGGFNFRVEYQGFDISGGLQFSYGNDIYNANLGTILQSGDGGNRHAKMNDRWSEENPDGKYPRAMATDVNANDRPSDLFIEDASFIRLNNLELGYSLPQKWVAKRNVSALRLYLSGQNILTITNYSGYSPDIGQRGFDASVYPVAKKYLIGLKLSF